MHVLITGANGFIGRALSRRLCRQARLGGKPITRLSLLDLTLDDPPVAPFVHPVAGDLADVAWLRHTLAELPVDLIFHLASIPGGLAEQQYELARRVKRVRALLLAAVDHHAQVEVAAHAPGAHAALGADLELAHAGAQVALRADGGAMPLGVVFHGSAGWAAADQAGTGYALPAAVVGECGAQVAVGDACVFAHQALGA